MKVISIPIDEKPDWVINLAQLSINAYTFVRGKGIVVREVLFAPLKLIIYAFSLCFKVVTSISAIFVLVALIFTMLSLLCVGNTIFYLMGESILNDYKKLDRKMAMDKHLKIETAFKTMGMLKKSKLLFRSPVLGSLNKTFYKNLERSETTLRAVAYPNLGITPQDITIHSLSDEDPWQDDLELYTSEEITTLT